MLYRQLSPTQAAASQTVADLVCVIHLFIGSFQSVMVSENAPLLLCVCSSLFRINWLVSINRSTQLTKHISVLESSFGPGLSIHFSYGYRQNSSEEVQETPFRFLQLLLNMNPGESLENWIHTCTRQQNKYQCFFIGNHEWWMRLPTLSFFKI